MKHSKQRKIECQRSLFESIFLLPQVALLSYYFISVVIRQSPLKRNFQGSRRSSRQKKAGKMWMAALMGKK